MNIFSFSKKMAKNSFSKKMAKNFPTANTLHMVELSLYVNGQRLHGETVREFFSNIFSYLDKASKLGELNIPMHTSGENVLVNHTPHHLDGREFETAIEYVSRSENTLFININHPRFFALRQGARVFEAVGLEAKLTP